jgi:hypothetical protein
VKVISKLVDGTARVQTCEVVNSTFHKIDKANVSIHA